MGHDHIVAARSIFLSSIKAHKIGGRNVRADARGTAKVKKKHGDQIKA
jgi:hypothetical protein